MPASYEDAGVRQQGEALSAVARHLRPTFSFPSGARVLTDFGHYASVLQLSDDLALAICTDGVGSKTIVASALDRYDTIGFDCMAMNVNDLICVGATPIAMVDYLGVHTLDDRRTDQMLEGLGAAAKAAGVAVPGGELAQLPEVIGSDGTAPGDERAFDLVGTAVGTLHPDRLVLGRDVRPGDALVGLASSGLHSNGYTLARRVLLRDARLALDTWIDELGRTLGEELLEPTEIYVRPILALAEAGIAARGLVHITGDGFLNMCRLEADVGFRIERVPWTRPIFELIARLGRVPATEMFRVFNMGIGFVAIVGPGDVDATVETLRAGSADAAVIGTVTDDRDVVEIVPAGVRGSFSGGDGYFEEV